MKRVLFGLLALGMLAGSLQACSYGGVAMSGNKVVSSSTSINLPKGAKITHPHQSFILEDVSEAKVIQGQAHARTARSYLSRFANAVSACSCASAKA